MVFVRMLCSSDFLVPFALSHALSHARIVFFKAVWLYRCSILLNFLLKYCHRSAILPRLRYSRFHILGQKLNFRLQKSLSLVTSLLLQELEAEDALFASVIHMVRLPF